ncbi:MAG TPA: ABC transporter permease, partial [Bryobacteraceae bacterium]|nr:ABC transporter permease [Bryobacteraceae bacterium]
DASVSPPERPSASLGVASPGLFRLLGIPIVAGRAFDERDDARHPLAAVVNRAFARRYFGTGEGVGARMKVGFWNGRMKPWSEFQIVGVVADARNRSLDSAPEPAIYLSSRQVPLEGFQYFVRTRLPAASLAEGFRAAVWRVDPALERIHPRPLAPYVEAGLEQRKLAVWLIGLFGSVALLVAAAGLAAAMSALVSASKKEIAIRAALGETPGRAVARVLIRAVRLAAAGAGAGAAAAMLMRPASVLPACCAGALVLVVALLASATPARRAASMDAMESLRSE